MAEEGAADVLPVALGVVERGYGIAGFGANWDMGVSDESLRVGERRGGVCSLLRGQPVSVIQTGFPPETLSV